jgi:hypothetical protein
MNFLVLGPGVAKPLVLSLLPSMISAKVIPSPYFLTLFTSSQHPYINHITSVDREYRYNTGVPSEDADAGTSVL